MALDPSSDLKLCSMCTEMGQRPQLHLQRGLEWEGGQEVASSSAGRGKNPRQEPFPPPKFPRQLAGPPLRVHITQYLPVLSFLIRLYLE